jgi:hypothetical protein
VLPRHFQIDPSAALRGLAAVREEQMNYTEEELVTKTVQLGNVIRRHRSEGNLQSLSPPTIYGYQAFLRLAKRLPHLQLQQVALSTLLGNASMEDRKLVMGVFSEVFGLQADIEEDPTLGGNLF